jgi:LuxR family transcriptional regulator
MMDAWIDRISGALGQAFDRDSAFAPILAAAQALDFEYCAFGIRLALPISNPRTFMVNNYPEQWQRRYSDSGYLNIDPTAIHGRRSQTAIVWSDAVFRDASQMWAEAKSFNLKIGIAQSTFGGNGFVSMLTLSRSGTPLTPAELSEIGPYIRWLADLAHGALSGTFASHPNQFALPPELTVREVEILKWMADGKTSNDTAYILNLSVATVNFHMKNAISKLNASNKTCAVAKALILGLLD